MMAVRLIVILAAVVMFVVAPGCRRGAQKDKEDDLAFQTFTETGELKAVRNRNASMPWFHWDYGRPQITFLEEEGKVVKKGDLVAEIENSGVLKALEQKETDLAIALADLNKMKVDHQSAMSQQEAELQSALSALQAARIDTQRVRYESESKRKIERLELRKSELSLERVRKKIKTTRRIQEQDIKISLAKISQIESAIRTAERTMGTFKVRAPDQGMIVYSQNRSTREKIKVGDQLYSGAPLVELPDLTQMKALTSVNETDIRKVEVGQKTLVRLDAFPKMLFPGKITSISNTCHRKERDSQIKVFDVQVLLDETHRVLKPGMTVSCEFLLRKMAL